MEILNSQSFLPFLQIRSHFCAAPKPHCCTGPAAVCSHMSNTIGLRCCDVQSCSSLRSRLWRLLRGVIGCLGATLWQPNYTAVPAVSDLVWNSASLVEVTAVRWVEPARQNIFINKVHLPYSWKDWLLIKPWQQWKNYPFRVLAQVPPPDPTLWAGCIHTFSIRISRQRRSDDFFKTKQYLCWK